MYIPKKASTKPETPFMAERNMEGSIWRQGCWLGSMTRAEEMAYLRKAGVLLITVWRLRSTGFPKIKPKLTSTISELMSNHLIKQKSKEQTCMSCETDKQHNTTMMVHYLLQIYILCKIYWQTKQLNYDGALFITKINYSLQNYKCNETLLQTSNCTQSKVVISAINSHKYCFSGSSVTHLLVHSLTFYKHWTHRWCARCGTRLVQYSPGSYFWV